MNKELVEAFSRGFEAPFRGEIWEWAEKNITLPPSYAIPGRLNFRRSKYLKQPLEDLKNPRIRRVIIRAAVQTAKSLIADVFVPYVLSNDAGNILWILQDDDFVKKYAETRVNPILSTTEPTRNLIPRDRTKRLKTSIVFPSGVSLIMGGANLGNLQSLSIRFLIMDECWLYADGLIRQGLARTTAYPHTSKVLLLSQAGTEGDDFESEFHKGHCAEWGWKCPACGHEQKYELNKQRIDGTWAGLLWDTNETTKPNNKYNYVELGKTVRLSCFECRHEVYDTPSNRRLLNETGVWLVDSPNADPSIRSYTWPGLANMDISFASFATDYLQAKTEHKESGYMLPLQEFHQKKLAKPWAEDKAFVVKEALAEAYDVASEWTDETHRFLTIDVQRDCFWYVIRAWASKTGESRLLSFGRVETWEQLRELQEKFKVRDQHTFVDGGYEQVTVASKCVQFGHEGTVAGRKYWLCWTVLKGTAQDNFLHIQGKKRDRRIYSPVQYINPALGTSKQSLKCPMYLWATNPVKSILKRHRDGLAAKYIVPAGMENLDEYNAQLNSEYQKKEVDRKTGRERWVWTPKASKPNNHLWDCENMQIVAAGLAAILGGKREP